MDYIKLLNSMDLEVLFRLIVAMIFGVLVGKDRSKSGSPAGIKTHSLVALGSALVVLFSEYALRYGGTDITRMPAQVISGIGFLGAGTILVTGEKQIQGLTSAASIWFTACIGLAVGAGFYTGALYAVCLELFVMKILKRWFDGSSHGLQEIYIQYGIELKFVDVIKVLRSYDCSIVNVDNKKFSGHQFESDFHKISVLVIKLDKDISLDQILNRISEIQGMEVVGIL